MPKSTKKQKDKAADFSKAKLKLGKGKQTPSNVVDTSFKARSIALPSQSIAQTASSSAPSTKRKLTLEDLLSHLKHYNAATRRDAMFGLRELFEENPEFLLPSLTALLNGSVRVLADEDASVRKALLGFWSWLFPRVSKEDLVPHAPVLLLFTTSALTHIFPQIRIDAIRVVDLLLQNVPSVVVDGWSHASNGHGRRVLEGYLGILSAGTAFGETGDSGPPQATSSATVILSPKSKLVVMNSLATFLSLATSSQPGQSPRHTEESKMQPTPSWFFAASFSSESAFDAFDNLIRPHLSASSAMHHPQSRQWQEDADAGNCSEDFVSSSCWAVESLRTDIALGDLADVGRTVGDAGSGDGTSARLAYITQLARTLQPILVTTFLDCAASVFAPGTVPPETEVGLILAVADLARVLYGNAAPRETGVQKDGILHEGANALLAHMAPYFPFKVDWPSSARRDIKLEDAFQSMNLIFCELASALILNNPPVGTGSAKADLEPRSSSKRTSGRTARLASVHLQRVREYVVGVLRGEVSVSSGLQPAISRSIGPSAYTALLPTIWALIDSEVSENSNPNEQVITAVLEHAMRASSTSAVKRHTVEFVGRILLLAISPGTLKSSRWSSHWTANTKAEEWLLHLPQTLWELRKGDPLTTEIILLLLLRLVQRRSSILTDTTLSSLSSRLAPYFTINHASRGHIRGPFCELNDGLMMLTLDLVVTMSPSEKDDLYLAVCTAISGNSEVYWRSLLERI